MSMKKFTLYAGYICNQGMKIGTQAACMILQIYGSQFVANMKISMAACTMHNSSPYSL
jgi:hypothetical protein